MAVSRVIEVSFGRSSVALVRIDTAYFYNNGILFKPTDIDLPASYQVHWADSPQATTTLETIGTAEGAPIPDDLWNRSRVIYGWIYLHPTEDSSVTGYEVRIYKNVRAGLPDGTEPTPAEQSTIDQLIGALNSAVEQTGGDAESASQSAQSAEQSAQNAQTYALSANTASDTAENFADAASSYASQAEQAKDTAEVYVGTAKGYAEQADASATASANSALASAQRANASADSATQAQGYAQSASASAQSASGYASNAQTSANTASTKATEASTSAQTASQKATEASQSASQALSYKTDAESAKTASQTAQGLAESARDSAVQAKTDAESARDDAVQAKEDAESAVASISDALDDKAPVITDTASGSIASFSDGADDLPLKSLVVDINPVQDLSHGDPSPENICPISGWTSVDVEQSGVNVWDEEWEVGEYGNDGTKANTGAGIRSKNYINVLPNLTYAFISTLNLYICEYDIDKNFIKRYYVVPLAPNKQVSSNCYYVTFNTASAYGATYNHDISINYPSTDHDYHPYTGRSITINLGQTVYGGKLDVLSGVLTVDMAMVDLGTLTWNYQPASSGKLQRFNTTGIATTVSKTMDEGGIMLRLLSSVFTASATVTTTRDKDNAMGVLASNGTLYITCSLYTDAATFKSAMSGVQLLYELAEPIEIQLTPNQVNSLLGVNNLWADSGDTEVEYRADTKLFIERLTAPDSVDMIADANITSGQYFMVGNSLYKATANIANGSAIIVGTNCIRKSLSEALNEINA